LLNDRSLFQHPAILETSSSLHRHQDLATSLSQAPDPEFSSSRPTVPPNNSPSVKTLYVNRDISHSIDGYVKLSDGTHRYFTAGIDDTLAGNVISIYALRRLRLDYEGYEEDLAPLLVFGSGRSQRSMGKITIQWNRVQYASGRYPTIEIECEVSQSSLRPELILGRPFCDAAGKLWRRSMN
jgi:hypothetical protein